MPLTDTASRPHGRLRGLFGLEPDCSQLAFLNTLLAFGVWFGAVFEGERAAARAQIMLARSWTGMVRLLGMFCLPVFVFHLCITANGKESVPII